MSIDLLKKLIREEAIKMLREAPEQSPTLVVKNLSQSNLWNCEIVGQLSDGAWENTRPFNHWEAWSDANVKIGPVVGYYGFRPLKTQYALDTQLIPYVGGRMLVWGAAGYAKIDLSIDRNAESAYEYFFTTYDDHKPGDLINKIKTMEFEALEKMFLDRAENETWIKPYADYYIKEKNNFKRVYDIIKSSSYSQGNLKADLNELKVAMNNNLPN